jgi:hypothetical protein
MATSSHEHTPALRRRRSLAGCARGAQARGAARRDVGPAPRGATPGRGRAPTYIADASAWQPAIVQDRPSWHVADAEHGAPCPPAAQMLASHSVEMHSTFAVHGAPVPPAAGGAAQVA